MHPEIRQQLYGGDIADYYPAQQQIKSSEDDNKDLSNIYNNQVACKKKFTGYPDNMVGLDKRLDMPVLPQ
jgi:hypothetical protein